MNNKGQTLILFLLIMPIIVGFLAFFIDLSLVKYEKNKVNSIITSNLKVIVNEEFMDIDKIKDVYLKNNIKVSNIDISNNMVIIDVKVDIKSIFGKILDFDMYKLSDKYYGNYLNKEVGKL